MSFSTAYPIVLIIICLAFAWFIARLLYRANSDLEGLSNWKLLLLRGLRTIVVFIISVLLLSPIIKLKRVKKEDPLLFVLLDNSFSMKNLPDSTAIMTELVNLNRLISNELESSFRIEWFKFDKELKEGGDLDYSGIYSGYSEALRKLNTKFNYRNPSGLILVGDGLYNVGENPVGISRNIEFPIYTVQFGDTIPKTDLSIINTRSAPVVFKNSSFPVEVEIAGKELPLTQVVLKISLKDKVLVNKSIDIDRKTFYSSENFVLKVPETGILNYVVTVSAIKGETNLRNNTRTIRVEAASDRQKVLILSDAPHPDIGAVKNVLDNSGYKTVAAINGNFSKYKPEDYNLLILYQLPSAKNGSANVQRFLDSKVPRWIFLTGNTKLEEFNNFDTGVEIEQISDENVELTVHYDEKFDLFGIDDELQGNVNGLPPLFAPYGKYSFNEGMQILLKQKVNDIIFDYPVMCIGVNNSKKTAVSVGEGIWRWRIMERQSGETSRMFSKIVTSTSKYLALKNNRDNFTVDYSRVVNSFDPIKFKAEVLDDLFEPVKDAEVLFQIKNSSGEDFNFVFDESGNGYELNAGNLPEGEYSFTASVETGNKKYTENGNFVVFESNAEQLKTTVNHKLFSQISEITGGRMFYPSESSELIEEIKEIAKSKNEMVEEDIFNVIHIKFVLFVLVLIAGTEWMLRRYWGTY